MRSRSVRNLPGAVALALLGSLLVTGCAQTRQSDSVEKSGFLKDYSQLREGEGDEAELIYVNESADFSKYKKVHLDHVTLWAKAEDSDLAKLSQDEQQMLTDYFYSALHKSVSKEYPMTDEAGPDVMRIRVAITEAEDANVTLNAITTIIPQLRLVSTLGGRAADVALMVGTASFEGEIVDSESGERLVAAVDRRVGTKTLRGVFSDWSDTEQAFDAWAEATAKRLKSLREK